MELLTACFLAITFSFGVGFLLVLTQRFHGRFTLDGASGVQKLHRQPTPRVGGLALAAGCAAGTVFLSSDAVMLSVTIFVAALPAFLSGLIEDLTKRVGVGLRLLATLLAGAIFVQTSGYAITDVDLPGVDWLLAIPVVAFVFTAFAIGGVANALNIVDGVNGLAAGTAMIVLCGFALIAAAVGDHGIVAVSLITLAALLGFFVLNFPIGRLFLGDAGAYGTGFVLAALAVALPQRNVEVSPVIGLLLLAYPVCETMVSIRRRMVRAGAHPGQPDRLHLHSLVFRHQALRSARWIGRPHLRNPMATVLVWWLPLLSVALALGSWRNSAAVLVSVAVIFAGFLWHYRRVALIRRPSDLRALPA